MADSTPDPAASPDRRPPPRRRRRTLRWTGAVVVALLLGGVGALAVSAQRAGLSVRAQAVRLSTALLSEPLRDEAAYRDQVEARQAAGPAAPPASFAKEHAVTRTTTEGSAVFTVAPRDGRSDRRVLFLHGGAYVGELTAPYWSVIGRLVDQTGATVVVPAYPLAPRHDWRAAHTMVRSVYRELVAEVGAPRITIAGDSAGGGLAVAVAQELRDEGAPAPAGLVLFSPWLDAAVDDPAQPALDEQDHLLTVHGLHQAGRWWAGDLPVGDPRISPRNGSLAGLPPMTVFTGTDDLLHPDAVGLKSAADAAGVRCDLVTVRHEVHAWILFFPDRVPEAARAIDRAVTFIVARTA